jgi:septal ring factor EnvC (AmiA/AmiB activator)
MISRYLPVLLRRLAVVVGLAGSIVLGATTVGAAATWTASAAPLNAPPQSAESLASQLADEQARAAELQQNLDALNGNGTDLASALDAARAQMAADAKTAASLEARLAKAKARLAALEKSLAAKRVVHVTSTPRPTGTGAPAGGEPEDGSDD